MVIPSLAHSGTSKQLLLLASGLPRPPFEVRIAVLGKDVGYAGAFRAWDLSAAQNATPGAALPFPGNRPGCSLGALCRAVSSGEGLSRCHLGLRDYQVPVRRSASALDRQWTRTSAVATVCRHDGCKTLCAFSR